MFEISEYLLEYELNTYKVSVIYVKFVKKYIASITNKTNLVYVAFKENEQSPENIYHFSYVTNASIDSMKQLLFSCLLNLSIQIPIHSTYSNIIVRPLQKKESEHIYIYTYNHKYRFHVKEQTYYYYITVGGNIFHSCIEIFVYKDGQSTLSQVYSEPECTAGSFLEEDDGNVVDMIKSALQACQLLFGVHTFTLLDMSEIECNKKDMTKPIGKRITKPFSLTHLSIINHCKTWYESKFNARILNKNDYDIYLERLTRLNTPIEISLESLAKDPITKITDEQKKDLERYFSPTKTWIQFLRSIPTAKQCELLTWTPRYLDKIMDFKPRNHEWIINLEDAKFHSFPFSKEPKKENNQNLCDTKRELQPMKPTLMIPFGISRQKGGFQRKTRKRKTGIVFRQKQAQYETIV